MLPPVLLFRSTFKLYKVMRDSCRVWIKCGDEEICSNGLCVQIQFNFEEGKFQYHRVPIYELNDALLDYFKNLPEEYKVSVPLR